MNITSNSEKTSALTRGHDDVMISKNPADIITNPAPGAEVKSRKRSIGMIARSKSTTGIISNPSWKKDSKDYSAQKLNELPRCVIELLHAEDGQEDGFGKDFFQGYDLPPDALQIPEDVRLPKSHSQFENATFVRKNSTSKFHAFFVRRAPDLAASPNHFLKQKSEQTDGAPYANNLIVSDASDVIVFSTPISSYNLDNAKDCLKTATVEDSRVPSKERYHQGGTQSTFSYKEGTKRISSKGGANDAGPSLGDEFEKIVDRAFIRRDREDDRERKPRLIGRICPASVPWNLHECGGVESPVDSSEEEAEGAEGEHGGTIPGMRKGPQVIYVNADVDVEYGHGITGITTDDIHDEVHSGYDGRCDATSNGIVDTRMKRVNTVSTETTNPDFHPSSRSNTHSSSPNNNGNPYDNPYGSHYHSSSYSRHLSGMDGNYTDGFYSESNCSTAPRTDSKNSHMGAFQDDSKSVTAPSRDDSKPVNLAAAIQGDFKNAAVQGDFKTAASSWDDSKTAVFRVDYKTVVACKSHSKGSKSDSNGAYNADSKTSIDAHKSDSKGSKWSVKSNTMQDNMGHDSGDANPGYKAYLEYNGSVDGISHADGIYKPSSSNSCVDSNAAGLRENHEGDSSSDHEGANIVKRGSFEAVDENQLSIEQECSSNTLMASFSQTNLSSGDVVGGFVGNSAVKNENYPQNASRRIPRAISDTIGRKEAWENTSIGNMTDTRVGDTRTMIIHRAISESVGVSIRQRSLESHHYSVSESDSGSRAQGINSRVTRLEDTELGSMRAGSIRDSFKQIGRSLQMVRENLLQRRNSLIFSRNGSKESKGYESKADLKATTSIVAEGRCDGKGRFSINRTPSRELPVNFFSSGTTAWTEKFMKEAGPGQKNASASNLSFQHSSYHESAHSRVTVTDNSTADSRPSKRTSGCNGDRDGNSAEGPLPVHSQTCSHNPSGHASASVTESGAAFGPEILKKTASRDSTVPLNSTGSSPDRALNYMDKTNIHPMAVASIDSSISMKISSPSSSTTRSPQPVTRQPVTVTAGTVTTQSSVKSANLIKAGISNIAKVTDKVNPIRRGSRTHIRVNPVSGEEEDKSEFGFMRSGVTSDVSSISISTGVIPEIAAFAFLHGNSSSASSRIPGTQYADTSTPSPFTLQMLGSRKDSSASRRDSRKSSLTINSAGAAATVSAAVQSASAALSNAWNRRRPSIGSRSNNSGKCRPSTGSRRSSRGPLLLVPDGNRNEVRRPSNSSIASTMETMSGISDTTPPPVTATPREPLEKIPVKPLETETGDSTGENIVNVVDGPGPDANVPIQANQVCVADTKESAGVYTSLEERHGNSTDAESFDTENRLDPKFTFAVQEIANALVEATTANSQRRSVENISLLGNLATMNSGRVATTYDNHDADHNANHNAMNVNGHNMNHDRHKIDIKNKKSQTSLSSRGSPETCTTTTADSRQVGSPASPATLRHTESWPESGDGKNDGFEPEPVHRLGMNSLGIDSLGDSG